MNIAFVSSSRSDIGLILPVIRYMVRETRAKVELVLVGALAHAPVDDLLEGLRRVKIHTISNRTSVSHMGNQEQMINAFSEISAGFSHWLNKRKTPLDWVFIPGDRFEIFAVAVAAFYNNFPIAHIFGGDRSMGGHLDDSARHAISKLAHIHFSVSEDSTRRLLRLGEEPWRVHKVGSPVVESAQAILGTQPFSLSELIEPRRYNVICSYNPITTESERAGQQLDAILQAFRKLQKNLDVAIILTHPNNEHGSRAIVQRLRKLKKKQGYFVFTSLGHKRFLQTLSQCDLFVGNSSSALLEAPIIGTPSLDIGSRQKGRYSPNSVHHIEAYDSGQIAKRMETLLRSKKKNPVHPYGNGTTSKRVHDVLEKIQKSKSRLTILQKKINY